MPGGFPWDFTYLDSLSGFCDNRVQIPISLGLKEHGTRVAGVIASGMLFLIQKEDVELIAKLGFGAYRFSISWSRIFPDGLGNKINEDGIKYYNNLINALLERGVEPYLTLYHWDLPLTLHESIDGWLSDKIVKYFEVYAETCFANFGDRVKHWITFNEPLQTAVNGYAVGIFAPGRSEHPLTEPYLAAHYQLLAHAAAVSVYNKKFQVTVTLLIPPRAFHY
ncbi:hypothetical protein Sjap_009562 [Stephania japonica]|uniref:Beta-glucosidase n=1 Tax=Stephania japonica TaxID=461633 RepID=A0AAP0PBU4_9MAGN